MRRAAAALWLCACGGAAAPTAGTSHGTPATQSAGTENAPSVTGEARPATAARPPSGPDVAPPDLSNVTLPNVCGGPEPTLTFEDGTASYESGLGEGFRGEVEIAVVVRADLDGDAQYEWLALIVCYPGGSGSLDGVYAFHFAGGSWQLIAELRGGDRADGGLDPSFRVEGTEVVVGRYSGDDEGLCCPTHVTEERWQLVGGAFQRTSVGRRRPVHPDG